MKIGFVGAGRMASALACGIARSFESVTLYAFDPAEKAVLDLKDQLKEIGVDLHSTDSNQELVSLSDIVMLAVKPQIIDSALANLSARDDRQLFVSVVAGTRMESLVKLLGTSNVVRAMPNTPCLIGSGVTASCRSESVTDESYAIVQSIFESVGVVVDVSEFQMDAVTGLSGSGPAYVYTFIEALIDAGVLAGLPRRVAQLLAVQTVAGATEMVGATGEHPAVLRDQVTSPGGTTIHGLQQIEKLGFRESVLGAVKAATERSVELSGN